MAQSSDYVFMVSDVVGEVGTTQEMTVTVDSTTWGPIEAWSYGMALPPGVEVESVTLGSEPAALHNGAGPDYHVVNILPEGFTVAVLITATSFPDVLDPGVNELTVISLQLDEPEGVSAAEIVDTLGSPPIATRIEVDGLWVYPSYVGGLFAVGPLFQRGDCNADGNVDIADSIFVESYLFLGGDTPSCLRACDTNDDGLVNIADSIYGLNYLFVDGPPPATPHGECGIDPTPDSITCESPAVATCL